jgi:hypothetical protein
MSDSLQEKPEIERKDQLLDRPCFESQRKAQRGHMETPVDEKGNRLDLIALTASPKYNCLISYTENEQA